MKQRKWSAEEKLAIVLEGLKEKRFVAEIERLQKVIGKEAIQIEI
jgi:transposase-like protein